MTNKIKSEISTNGEIEGLIFKIYEPKQVIIKVRKHEDEEFLNKFAKIKQQS